MIRIYYYILIGVIFNSCSRTFYIEEIIEHNSKKSKENYTFTFKDNYYLTNAISIFSHSKQFRIDSLKSILEKHENNPKLPTKEESVVIDATKSKLNTELLNKDSSKQILISFNEDLQNIKYKLIAIKHWNYSNIRFLIPLLPLGNKLHLRNQCINRAIEECRLIGADGAIINSNLYSSKLFKLVK